MYEILNYIQGFPDTASLITHLGRRRTDGPFTVSFCNAHSVNLAYSNPQFREDLLSADLLLRDGSGVKIAMRLLGLTPGANLNGTDIIPLILKGTPRARLGIYGTQQPWLSKSAEEFGKIHEIVAVIDGFQPAEIYVQSIKQEKPDIVLLGMGMPKQENVARVLSQELDYPCLIINGGAILDFTAQRFDRAPHWMRRIGMEWFFRLVNEPKRLFGRYVIGNGTFLIRLSLCALRQQEKAIS